MSLQIHSTGGGKGGEEKEKEEDSTGADSTEIVSPGADGWIPLLVAHRAEHSYLASQSEARRAGPTAGRQERNTPVG